MVVFAVLLLLGFYLLDARSVWFRGELPKSSTSAVEAVEEVNVTVKDGKIKDDEAKDDKVKEYDSEPFSI